MDLFNIKIYYINLKDRIERNKEIIAEINSLGQIDYERFNAIKPSLDDIIRSKMIKFSKLWNFKSLQDEKDKKYVIGATGCKMSHYNVLKNIVLKNENYDYYIILEDDCVFTNNTKDGIYDTLRYIESNNIDFNILYLGCNFYSDNDFEIIDNNLLKCNLSCGLTTHALLFKKNKIEKIIEIIEKSDAEIDNAYMTLDNRYVCYPMIANQRLTISDIGIYRCYNLAENTYISYGDFNKDFIKNKMEQWLKDHKNN